MYALIGKWALYVLICEAECYFRHGFGGNDRMRIMDMENQWTVS